MSFVVDPFKRLDFFFNNSEEGALLEEEALLDGIGFNKNKST